MILKEQQRPYQDEIRETVRFMKEVVEQVPHKVVSSESSSPVDTGQRYKYIDMQGKSRSKKNPKRMFNFKFYCQKKKKYN